MMFAKTVCNPGSFVEVMPFGLFARLQYNADGILQSIQPTAEPYNDNIGESVSNDVFSRLANRVPMTISLKGGTTWVEGVFYSQDISKLSGKVPECLVPDYEERCEELTFYAGHVTSLAASFRGALTVRNWLSINHFNLLPGAVVPIEMTEDTIKMMITTGAYSFEYPYIAGYMVYEGMDYRFVDAGLSQGIIASISSSLDENGYGKTSITLDTGVQLVVNYSDTVRFNLIEGRAIVYYLDEATNILQIVSCRDAIKSAKDNPVSDEVKCPICGKVYQVPKSGPVCCDDPHCLSVLYPDSCRMLTTLGMPELTFDQYAEHVANNDILCLTDILILPEFKETKPKATLADAIKSIVPVSVSASDEFFEKFANSCNQCPETVMYYAQNPQRIPIDLGMNSLAVSKFTEWVSDGYNLTSLMTVLGHVEIEARKAKFEGAPIFRSNKFVITGKFKRGSFSEIASIIESYSGTVLPDMQGEIPDAVITGGTDENISGAVIRSARAAGIPIVDEDTFFNAYGIDEDLAANLL